MNWLALLRTLGIYAAVIIALSWGIAQIPRCSRAVANHDYRDVTAVPAFEGRWYDGTVTIEQLRRDDLIVFTRGTEQSVRYLFAYVGGLPGDQVEVRDGNLLINGRSVERGALGKQNPDRLPFIVPAGHVYILSDAHIHDSIAHGPLPRAALLGRVTEK
jgi:signal peptidase I